MRPLLLGALAVVAAVTVGCDSASAIPGLPAPASAPSSGTPDAAKKAADGVRGEITAETGSTWTVTTARGRAFTVTVDGATVFGTTADPGTAAQFPIGTTVRVTGARNGTAVTATRIAVAKDKATATPAPATPVPATTAPGA